MSNGRFICAVFISIITAYACDSGVHGYSSADIFGCTSNVQCRSNKCLDHGRCAEIVGLKGLCDNETSFCLDGLKCSERGECIPEDGKERFCQFASDCGEFGSGAVCKDSICMRNNGDCLDSIDCTFQGVNKECIRKSEGNLGRCSYRRTVGEECDDEYNLCVEDGLCRSGKCIQILGEGDRCFAEAPFSECDRSQELECIDDYCRKKTIDQQMGEPCHDVWQTCHVSYACVHGKCQTVVENHGDTCSEDENVACNEAKGLYCAYGTCLSAGAECADSGDCSDDSYCCDESACGKENVCLQYQEGQRAKNHDDQCRTQPEIGQAAVQCNTLLVDRGMVGIPLVGHFGNDMGLDTVIAVLIVPNKGVSGDRPSHKSIEFINPMDCGFLSSVEGDFLDAWYQYPAAADFDGDGILELIANVNGGDSRSLALYRWDKTVGKYVQATTKALDFRAAPMIFDIDSDDKPEIVSPFGLVVRVNVKTDEDGNSVFELENLYDHEDLYSDGNTSEEGLTQKAGSTAAIGYLFDELSSYTNADGIQSHGAQLVTVEGIYAWQNMTWDKIVQFESPANPPEGPENPDDPANPDDPQDFPIWVRQFPAYADFGTASADGSFDFKKLDGRPEIVISGKNALRVYAIVAPSEGEEDYKALKIMEVDGLKNGGPVAISDFDGDGRPEIAFATQERIGVYDPLCANYEKDRCADKNVLWERRSPAGSNGTAGVSAFDFNLDGQVEVIYGDGCAIRIYDGKTGRVLSRVGRSTETTIDYPVIADVDGDGGAEILYGTYGSSTCTDIPDTDNLDALEPGISCESDDDCKGQTCYEGLCTCTEDADCADKRYRCVTDIDPRTDYYYNVEDDESDERKQLEAGDLREPVHLCRAVRNPSIKTDRSSTGFVILNESSGHWAAARPLWNQYAYNVANIEDNGRVPGFDVWQGHMEETVEMSMPDETSEEIHVYNHYRMNTPQDAESGKMIDLTSSLDVTDKCKYLSTSYTLSGKVCNRGMLAVAAGIPFVFEMESDDALNYQSICSGATNAAIGVGECIAVSCSGIVNDGLTDRTIRLTVNEEMDGTRAFERECRVTNNSAYHTVLETDCVQQEVN